MLLTDEHNRYAAPTGVVEIRQGVIVILVMCIVAMAVIILVTISIAVSCAIHNLLKSLGLYLLLL